VVDVALHVLVAFFLGMAAGFFALKELIRWSAQFKVGYGPCQLCQTTGHLIICRRCSRYVAMCCYIQVLGTDDPSPHMRRRRGTNLCVRCITVEEKEIVEKMVGP
jgi:hypothetical protein